MHLSLKVWRVFSGLPGWRTLHVLLGLLLIAAAWLKGTHLTPAPLAIDWIDHPAVQITGIVIESVIGLALLIALFPSQTNFVSLVLFTIFCVISIAAIARHRDSCGCFGNYLVNPRATAAIDFLVIVLLAAIASRVRQTRHHGPRIALFSFSLLAFWGALAFTVSGNESPIGLIAEYPLFERGNITPAEAAAVEHVFVLRNTSDRPLNVENLATSCGCTTASTPTGTLKPGRELPIRVIAKWQGRVGKQVAQIFLTTNDPNHPKITLAMTGVIQTLINFSPPELSFNGIQPGEERLQRVTIAPGQGQPPFRIMGFDSGSRSISAVGFKPVLVTGPTNFVLACRGTVNESREHGCVRFETDVAQEPILELPYSSHSVGQLVAAPSRLYFVGDRLESQDVHIGGADSDAPIDCAITADSAGLPFALKSTRSTGYDSSKMISVTCEPGKSRVSAMLHVRAGTAVLTIPLVRIGTDGS